MKTGKTVRMMLGMVVVVTMAVAGPWVSATTLTNPGFETGDFTGWSTFGTGWRTSTGADAHTGIYGVVDDVNTNDTDVYRGVFQNVSITPGAHYSGSVWIRAVNVETSRSYFELQFLDITNAVVTTYQSSLVTSDQPFTLTSIANIVAPANAVALSVRGIVWMPSAPTINTDFHIFDDFQVTELVPEPSVAGLLVFGGLLAAARRRRKA